MDKQEGLLLELSKDFEGLTFVCGDIHGCYDDLMEQLEKHNFDFNEDRLICTGDLIDRGPDSELCVSLVDEDWFYTVRGNHEDIALQCLEDASKRGWWVQNGGAWFLSTKNGLIADKMLNEFSKLPLGIEVIVEGKVFAIVHADPVGMSWINTKRSFKEAEEGSHEYETAIWSRANVDESEQILGCDLMIHGHTIQDMPTQRGNRLFLDTGSFLKHWEGYEGGISVVCLNELAEGL